MYHSNRVFRWGSVNFFHFDTRNEFPRLTEQHFYFISQLLNWIALCQIQKLPGDLFWEIFKSVLEEHSTSCLCKGYKKKKKGGSICKRRIWDKCVFIKFNRIKRILFPRESCLFFFFQFLVFSFLIIFPLGNKKIMSSQKKKIIFMPYLNTTI